MLRPSSYTRREFVETYTLNRAKGHSGGMDGPVVVREAYRAWAEIARQELLQEAGK